MEVGDQNLFVVVVAVVVVVLANFEVASIEVVLEAYQAFLALLWRSLRSSSTDPTLSIKQEVHYTMLQKLSKCEVET